MGLGQGVSQLFNFVKSLRTSKGRFVVPLEVLRIGNVVLTKPSEKFWAEVIGVLHECRVERSDNKGILQLWSVRFD
jgi:hypothetical protein